MMTGISPRTTRTTRPLVPEQADLSLSKTVSSSVPNVGDVVSFTIAVTNGGPDTATNVSVEDIVPAGYSGISNISSGGTLVGSTITWSGLTVTTATPVVLTFDATVEAPTGTLGEFTNVAEVTASDQFDPDSTPGNDDGDQSEDDEDNASVTPVVADLRLVKAVSDLTPNVGDVVTFTITVTNDGPNDATGVAVEDVVPGGYSTIGNISGGGVLVGSTITWSGLAIADGDSEVLTFEATVNAPPWAYRNVAQVTASDTFDPDSTPGNDDGDQSEDDESRASVTPQQADVSLLKSVSDASPNVGDTVTFTVTVTNGGPDTATNVSVEDVVPVGVSGVSNISGGGVLLGGVVTWSGLTVTTGAPVVVTFDAIVEAPTGAAGEYTNVAQVTAGDQFDPDSTPGNDDGDQSEDDEDNAVFVPQVADLSLVKGISDTAPLVGQVVTFTVTVNNAGPADATNVAVADVVPTGYSTVTNISSGGTLAGSTIAWSGQLVPAGGSINLTFDATVEAPPAGYLNVAEVTASDQYDPDSTPGNDDGDQSEDDEDNVGLAPQESDLSLDKAISDAAANVGDVVTFTITVTNAGPDDATNVAVEDSVPAGYSNISNVSSGGVVLGSTITWSGLAVSTSAPLVVTFDAVVDAPTGAAGEYVNVAEVTASDQVDPDSTPGNDDGDQSEDDEDNAATVPQQADLSLTKAVSAGGPNVGDVVSFTVTVTNAGPDDATGVAVEDVVPAGYSNVTNISNGGTLAGGAIRVARVDGDDSNARGSDV